MQDLETVRKVQRLALREEIDGALREARQQRELGERLAERNRALQAQSATLDRIAHEDALTGIGNRRRFEAWIAALPQRLPATFAVAVLDLDHFKQINDRHSHAVGDAVLKVTGGILRAHCRDGDLVARLGGEEFVLIQDVGSPDQALAVCERVRLSVQGHPWPAIQPALTVTVSVGLTMADGVASVEELLRRADQNLYEAKRGGRNRVAWR